MSEKKEEREKKKTEAFFFFRLPEKKRALERAREGFFPSLFFSPFLFLLSPPALLDARRRDFGGAGPLLLREQARPPGRGREGGRRRGPADRRDAADERSEIRRGTRGRRRRNRRERDGGGGGEGQGPPPSASSASSAAAASFSSAAARGRPFGALQLGQEEEALHRLWWGGGGVVVRTAEGGEKGEGAGCYDSDHSRNHPSFNSPRFRLDPSACPR